MIAVLVPARNEARRIGACLASIREAALHPALAGEDVRIVVAVDRCHDATARIAKDSGATTVASPVPGVGAARAAAATVALEAGARWLACTDADTRVPPHWLAGQLACGAEAFCGPVQVGHWRGYRAATRRAFELWEQLRDGHPHVHGANLGCSAEAYIATGGFAPLHTGEDVDLVRRLCEAGVHVARHGDPCVSTSARRDARAPAGFSRFLATLDAAVVAGSQTGQS